MKRLRLFACAACLTAGLAALAQQPEPSTQPAEAAPEVTDPAPPMDEGAPRDDGIRPYGRPWLGRWGGGMEDVSEEEWETASAFMHTHSPNRLKLFDRLSDGSMRRPGVKRMIIARHRNLMNLKEEDPALYDLRVQQLTIEDQIWSILREMRNTTDESARAKLDTELRASVKTSVETWMKEREHRLARLEVTLKREREKLESDRARFDAMVENRIQRELERVPSDYIAFPRGQNQNRGQGQ